MIKLKIIWSLFAEEKLDEIFEYHKTEANIRIARRLIYNLIKATDILIKNPYIGQVDELLIDRTESYRYLLHGNYKVIYSVDTEKGFIKIADIFDTRQNPLKISKSKAIV